MKRFYSLFALIVFLLYCPQQLAAQMSGRDIMEKVDERGDVKTEFNRSLMTLINKSGKTRERKITRYVKSYDGADGLDTKSLIIFDYPADIRGTGLLLWSYADPEKDDDRWLYLPALKKVRRIAGESKNDYFMGTDFTYDDMGGRNLDDDTNDYFMGTDFTYDDMGGRNLDDDTHKLLGKETVAGVECFKVESVPVDKNDAYSKKISWIIPDKWVFVKVEFYDKSGKLQKILTTSDIREIDGIWTPMVLFMDNLSKTHQTKIEVQEVKYNGPMQEQIFTQTTLKRGRVQ